MNKNINMLRIFKFAQVITLLSVFLLLFLYYHENDTFRITKTIIYIGFIFIFNVWMRITKELPYRKLKNLIATFFVILWHLLLTDICTFIEQIYKIELGILLYLIILSPVLILVSYLIYLREWKQIFYYD